MLSVCSVYAQCMFSVCSVYAQCMFSVCSVYAQCMLSVLYFQNSQEVMKYTCTACDITCISSLASTNEADHDSVDSSVE